MQPIRVWIFLFLLVTQSATYAATVLSQGVRNVKNGASYGGASAVGDGVHDDTQAFLDALNLGRRSTGDVTPSDWPFVAIYIPPGTYLVSQILVFRGPFMIFGEPSAPPTIVLKANAPYFASGANGGANPFIALDYGWRHPAYDNTWKLRDGTTYRCTNNDFDMDIRDINFTVQAGNPSCFSVMLWATAQQCSLRNVVLTADSAQKCALETGDPPGVAGSGGGGGIVANVTCTGGQAAMVTGNGSYYVFRGCTFNGPVPLQNIGMANFIACTFNNPNGAGLTASARVILDDCTFTANTPFSPSSDYHLENSAGVVQKTASSVYYNGALIPGTDSRLAVPGVIKGSPYGNPIYPEAPATTINVVTQLGVDGSGRTDASTIVNKALAGSNAALYFPPGNYLFNSTVNVGPGRALYGSGTGGCGFSCNGSPGIAVTGNGVAGVVLANIEVTGNANTFLQWDGDPSSQVLDFQVDGPGGSGPSAILNSGGGLIENAWWVANGRANGVQINSTGNLYLYSFAPEHYTATGMTMTNAQNVYGRAVQFEDSGSHGNFMAASGGSNNNLAGLITSGQPAAAAVILSNNPQISLWETDVYNSSATAELSSNGTNYGSGQGGSVLGGFVVPSAVTNKMPTASSAGVTNLGATKATFNGSVTSNGNQTVTSDGFDWGTSTAYGNTAAGATVQTGSFSANLTGLTTGQTYHYRAKAVNSLGTGFSGDTAFTPSPTPTPPPGPTTGPYKGTAAPVPGLVYASDYDLGGQGVGYQDSSNSNPGTYRTDGVDLAVTTDTASAGTGYVLGWRTAGEWNRYTVNAQAGKYTVSGRLESAVSTGKFHVTVDGSTVMSAVSVPLTGPWTTASSWKTLNLGAVTLTAGNHVVAVMVDAAAFNLNYLSFVPVVSAATSIKYVQGAYATPQTQQQTVPVTYTAAQTSGNLNVVIVGWNDTTAVVNSVKDSKGNVYKLAVGPTLLAGNLSQSIYYNPNILAASAGANAVTVTFSKPATYADIRILEYSGISQTSPVDSFASAVGNSTTSSSGNLTTTSATDLLIGANIVQQGTVGAGTGFTQRLLTSDGDIVEDQVVTSVGTYNASTALLAPSAGWDMQMVAFRAASQ
jgi:hypothetical protein